MTRRDVVVLGSTGSIGTQALDVCRANPDRFRVVALTAGGSNPDLFQQQVDEWAPAFSGLFTGLGEDASVRGRRAGVRRRPQRHHGGRRAPPDAGGAGRRQHPRAGQQGVADHRRPGGHQPREARPDRAGRLRALGPRAVPARRLRRGGTPPRPHRERRPVPRAYGGRPGRRHGRGGAGPPDLGHGSGRHHQLRDAGQQGPGGHRGAPAVRDPLRPHRGRGAPDERGALDGRVRRRLDARAGQPADHADPHRARPGVARPGARHRTLGRLDPRRDLGVLPARRRGVPGGVARAAGRSGRQHRARRLQRRQRGGRRGLPDRTPGVPEDRAHHRRRACAARRTLGGAAHRRRRPRRRRTGHATRPPASSGPDPAPTSTERRQRAR